MSKFTFVANVEGTVNGYDGYKVKTGDVVELGGSFAAKAEANPDYETCQDQSAKVTAKRSAPKCTAPEKPKPE